MPDQPLLRLPNPERIDPPRSYGGGPRINHPARDVQGRRLGPKFERLSRAIADPQAAIQLRSDPASIAPERAIVFEVIKTDPGFYDAAAGIGLELLGDDEQKFEPDQYFQVRNKPGDILAGRIYLAMPNLEALQQLVRVWQRYQSGQNIGGPFQGWTQLFNYLREVRPWGPEDRLLPETLRHWRETLQRAPDEPVRIEVELLFRDQQVRRRAAIESLRQQVEQFGGEFLDHAEIPEIRYDAVLIELPATEVQTLVDNPATSLALVDDIMFLRPQTVTSIQPLDERERDSADQEAAPPGDHEEPIAALLDGFPVQNHLRLAGRLVVEDPDNLEPLCPVASREHGTAMASLILHGDLNQNEVPLSRPLYVQPVLIAAPPGGERTPPNRLLVDVIYRAVRRIKEGEGDNPPVASSVILVNLSLGDDKRPFAGPMSPWARLLDYLAYRYRVLFLVSAGNIRDGLPIENFSQWTAFEEAAPEEREQAVLRALNANKGQRTLLSPAEALNVVTVGARHRDAVTNGQPVTMAVDPYESSDLPNVSSALGLGHRRIVKPEILLDGGREFVRIANTNPVVEVKPVSETGRAFGLKVAAPDPTGGDISNVSFTSGTSAATALATRAAIRIHNALVDRDGGSLHADVPTEFRALLVKALLIHGAQWGGRAEILDREIEPQQRHKHAERRDNIARLVGYGFPDIERVIDCTASRATLVGYDSVLPEHAHLYRIPLPPGLDGVREFRAVTITLAWFSQVNPRHQRYRMAALEIGAGGDKEFSLGVKRVPFQPDDKTAKRGTVLHDRRVGDKATAFVDGGHLLLRVNCRAPAGEFNEPVPYALAVSIEVGVESAIQVYDPVRAALIARVRAGVAGSS